MLYSGLPHRPDKTLRARCGLHGHGVAAGALSQLISAVTQTRYAPSSRRAAPGYSRLSALPGTLKATLFAILPFASLELLCRDLQLVKISIEEPGTGAPWRALIPNLAMITLMISVGYLLLTQLPAKWKPAAVVGMVLLSLSNLVCSVYDTAAVLLRMMPLNGLEIRQFLHDPIFISQVVLTTLSPPFKLALLAATILLFAGTVAATRAAHRALPVFPQRTSGWLLLISPVLLLASLLIWNLRGPLDTNLTSVSLPLAQRLIRDSVRNFLTEQDALASPQRPLLQVAGKVNQQSFNLIVVFLESTNRNATPLGGRVAPEVMPTLWSLAKGGLDYTSAYTGLPHTSKALEATLCGQVPEPGRLELEGDHLLPDTCLPKLLQSRGYRTALFQSADLSFEHRLELAKDMGYGLVSDGQEFDSSKFSKINYFGYEDRIVLEPALRWASQDGAPYFLTVVTSATHQPYGIPDSPALPAGATPTQLRQQHQAGLRYLDGFLRDLLEGIKTRRGLENTLVVILGDHGEAMAEHGQFFHDWVLYEEGVHIPLVLWGPEILSRANPDLWEPGSKVSGLRDQLDLYPTILDLLGWKYNRTALPGQSLLSAQGHSKLVMSCLSAQSCMALREGRFSYVLRDWSGTPEVYDLEADPDQKYDLQAQFPKQRLIRAKSILSQHKLQTEVTYAQLRMNRLIQTPRLQASIFDLP